MKTDRDRCMVLNRWGEVCYDVIRSCIASQDVIILKNVASTSYQHKCNVKARFVPFCTFCNYTYEQIVLFNRISTSN